jgi:hypothetical protein
MKCPYTHNLGHTRRRRLFDVTRISCYDGGPRGRSLIPPAPFSQGEKGEKTVHERHPLSN